MKEESNKSIILLIILIAHSCQMLSQIKTDTVCIGADRDKIIISYPEKSRVTNTYYEEGFFRDIYCIEDTALVGLHSGGMAYFDVVDSKVVNSQDIYISSEYVIANDFHQTRGFYYLKGEKKYFREDNILKYHIDLYYSNVPEEKFLFYESLLNSIKYLVNQNESGMEPQHKLPIIPPIFRTE